MSMLRSWSPVGLWEDWKAGPTGRLLAESFRLQGWLYSVAMIAMIVMASTAAGTAWIMEKIIDVMTHPEDRGAVFLVAGGVVALFVVRGVSSYLQAYFLARAGNRVVAMQQDRLYRKLLKRGVTFYQGTESSDLLMRFTQGAQSARALIDTLVIGFVRDLFTMLGLLAVMAYQQPSLSLICLVVGPLAFLGVRFLLREVKNIMQGQIMSLAEIIKVIQETSAGIEIIKVFGLENRMIDRMSGAVKQVETRSNQIKKLEAVTSPLMDILAGFAIAGVIVVSALGLGSGEPATAGQLMSFVTALLMTYEPAKRVSRMRVSIESFMVGVNMIFDLLDEEDPMQERPNAVALQPGHGKVEFRDVSYSYRADIPVIKHMNVTFQPGKTTALVGQSGGGKSTMAGLVMRFFDPDTGQVLINGQDLKDVTFDTLHENAHQFISDLPQGYDTPVGENGTFLSGGQKQRIAIARAILRKSEILLLDEATSALDTESEALVKNALKKLTEGRTTIVIAHRLSTILEADTVCVVHAGEVIEQGAPDALLQEDGAFKRLFEHQFKGGTEEADVDSARVTSASPAQGGTPTR